MNAFNLVRVLLVWSLLLAPMASAVHATVNAQTRSTEPIVTPAASNIALGKPVTVVTNDANDNRESPGLYPSDVTDGSLEYLPSSWAQEDGTVGYVNNDYNQLMVVTVTIDLQGTFDVTEIRYNMGHVERAQTWNADLMITPLGTTGTNPGTPYQGAWTTHYGNATLSTVTIILEKTRVSYATDWLFIGEIEVFGVPAGQQRPVFDLPFDYPNRGAATEQDFAAAWQRCTTAFFDHKLPGQKGASGDGLLWFWTGDNVTGTLTNCDLGQNCYDGHEGYDFDDWSCYGDDVYPAAAGEVIASETGWKNDGYGYRVVVRHGTSGYKTLYGHLQQVLVTSGPVETTTRIGKMGATGCPGCGTHLHFNVYFNNKLVDPSGWEGAFPDPNLQENGVESYRQWLFSVHRNTPVDHRYGTTFVTPSGSTVLQVPQMAYPVDFELTATELAPVNLPPQLVSAGHAAMFSARRMDGAAIDQFGRDLTLQLRFTPSDIAGIDAGSLSIYSWNSQQGMWIKLPTNTSMPTLNKANGSQTLGTATARTQSLGYIALLGETRHKVYMPLLRR